jgi:ubiquinone biosynthesis protein
MKRTAVDEVRERLRLQQVYNVFLRYGWDMAFQRLGLLNDLRLAMQRWVWQLPEDQTILTTPEKVRLMLEELGPTYVKMGQIVSSQASTLPPEWDEELEKLQSNVPPFPADLVREIMEEELGGVPENFYAAFDMDPLAAASTAQVHRATLFGGERVVVKVQRPGIRDQMKADMGIMQRASAVATRRSEELQAIDLAGMVEQFSTSVLNELDLQGEAYNAVRLADNLKDIEGVHIPSIYPELSTSKILTMEFIEGVKISNVEVIEAAGLDRAVIARNTLRALIKQLLIDGFFHADPHPGNVLVNLETGEVTFLDIGMVGQLDLNQRINLIQLLIAVQQRDVAGLGQILRSLSVPTDGDVDEKAFARDFERVVSRQFYVGAGKQVSLGRTVSLGLNLLREHGLRLDPNLTMAVKALVQAESAANVLFPEGGIVQEGAQIVQELAVQEVTAEKVVEVVKGQVMMSAREVVKRLPSLQEATIGWMDQYQKGRFEVHVDTSALGKEVDKLAFLGRQIVIAVMLVGMIIGTAISMSVLGAIQIGGRVWEIAFRLSYIGFVVATVITLFLILRALLRWMQGKSPIE